jgi:hypothetical protein
MSWDFNLLFHRMMEQAKQQYTSDFFMEIFMLGAWLIWKERNGTIFSGGGGDGYSPRVGKPNCTEHRPWRVKKKRNQKLSIQVHFRNQRRLHVQHVRFHLICKKGLINEDTLIKCTFNTMVGISSINEIFHGGKSYN